MGAILNKGKRISGNKATTGIGRASVTHKAIINTAKAITLLGPGSSTKGLIRNTIKATAIQINAMNGLEIFSDKQ